MRTPASSSGRGITVGAPVGAGGGGAASRSGGGAASGGSGCVIVKSPHE